uniref:NADH-ubiquinone oxidoreductase chain 3 n=1 Tax=Hydatigera krepkogorski TaxID=1434709 RepID=N0DLH5_9CEST|nr:NADH dehydrogenase subunit 3 [Hydatigera krepkogorski]BAN15685.1 NADH dehydrogenase subunit 3 [Hydatigera krepkogorski]
MFLSGLVLFSLLMILIGFFCCSLLNEMIKTNISWSSCYECGFFSGLMNLNCFSVTYFNLLIVFVIFDLEISLLLNMPTQGLMYWSFCGYYVFLSILLVGFLVEILSGYIKWIY